jgi:hypothetical protein
VRTEAARGRPLVNQVVEVGNYIHHLNTPQVRRPLSATVAPLQNLDVMLVRPPAAVLLVSDPEQNVELPADFLQRC